MPLAQTYQEARTQVERLTERFARNLDAYTRPDDQALYQRQIQATGHQIDLADGTLGAWSTNSTTSPQRRSPLSKAERRPDRLDQPVRSSPLHTLSPTNQPLYPPSRDDHNLQIAHAKR